MGNLLGLPLNIMIEDHEIIICPSPHSPETYRIILERPPNEKVYQIQNKNTGHWARANPLLGLCLRVSLCPAGQFISKIFND